MAADGRRATPDEQVVLARYVRWGGLANAYLASIDTLAYAVDLAEDLPKRLATAVALIQPSLLKRTGRPS